MRVKITLVLLWPFFTKFFEFSLGFLTFVINSVEKVLLHPDGVSGTVCPLWRRWVAVIYVQIIPAFA